MLKLNLEEIRQRLAKKRQELEIFQEEFGANMQPKADEARADMFLAARPTAYRYNQTMAELEEAAADSEATDKQKTINRKKLARGAAKEMVAVREREQAVKVEMKKRQVDHAKQVSAIVYREFWGNGAKLLRFFAEKRQKILAKMERERKMNEFLETQMSLADEILEEMSSKTSFLKKPSAGGPKARKLLTVVKLTRVGKKQFKFAGTDTKVLRVPLTKGAVEPHGGSLFLGKLREYQQVGVSWLNVLGMKRISCILADEMGLGKTVQTIAYFAALAEKEGIWGPHLVIVPTTVLGNWMDELRRFLPAFKIFPYFGRSCDRKAKRKGWSELDKFNICLTTYRIVAIDSNIFKRRRWFTLVLDEAHLIKNAKTLSFSALNRLKTFNRILLTGTPLQNRLTELWTLMTFIFPHKFEHKDAFCASLDPYLEKAARGNSAIYQTIIKKLHAIIRPLILRRLKKDVEKQMPKKIEKVILCDLSRRQQHLYDQFLMTSAAAKREAGILQNLNVLMQLRKICNHPDLVDEKISPSPLQLPPISYYVPSFLLVELREGATRAYEPLPADFARRTLPVFICISHYLHRLRTRIEGQSRTISFSQHLQLVNRLLHALDGPTPKEPIHPGWSAEIIEPQTHLQIVFPNIEAMSGAMEVACQHFLFPVLRCRGTGYHSNLLWSSPAVEAQTRWARRSAVSPLPTIFVNNINNFIGDSGKLQVLFQLLCRLRAEGKKVLIFTQMGKMLNLLEIFLSHKGFTYVRMDGSTYAERRQELVRQFSENPKVMVFISSTRVGGIGINLTAANTVIFYDCDWNPAVDKQAQDRCHRIGQSRDVTIYKLVTRASIEENILSASQIKSKIDDMVMNAGKFNLQSIFQQILSGMHGRGSDDSEFNRVVTGYLSMVEEEGDRLPDNPNLDGQEAVPELGDLQTSGAGRDSEGGDGLGEGEEANILTEEIVLPIYAYGMSLLRSSYEENSRELGLNEPQEAVDPKTNDDPSEKGSQQPPEKSSEDQLWFARVLQRRRLDLDPEEQESIIRASRRRVQRQLTILKAA